MNYEELETRLKVDRDKLDDEVMMQPTLFNEAAKNYAEAAGKRDLSKQVLEQMAAAMGQTIRTTSIDKITENKVKEAVEADPQYVAQYHAHLEYKKEAELWQGMVRAYDQRSKMLPELIKLFLNGYWGIDIRTKRGPDDVLVEEARAARRAARNSA